MATFEALVRKHPVLTYFVLTFTISWGGVLVVIGGPAANDHTESVLLAVVMHLSLTATTLILTPQTTGLPLLSYGLAFAVAMWAVAAVVAIGARRQPSRPARAPAAA